MVLWSLSSVPPGWCTAVHPVQTPVHSYYSITQLTSLCSDHFMWQQAVQTAAIPICHQSVPHLSVHCTAVKFVIYYTVNPQQKNFGPKIFSSHKLKEGWLCLEWRLSYKLNSQGSWFLGMRFWHWVCCTNSICFCKWNSYCKESCCLLTDADTHCWLRGKLTVIIINRKRLFMAEIHLFYLYIWIPDIAGGLCCLKNAVFEVWQ